MTRLSNATLAALPASVTKPDYGRSRVTPGVVHFGPGAFHRAHQAAAFDTLLASDPRWGITGVSLNSTSVAQALNPQDGLYTLALLEAETEFRVIGSVQRVLTGTERAAILAALTAPTTRIVSTTVTEKGYCLSSDGTLDMAHPAILADLDAPDTPKSVIGWLALGLAERRRQGLTGITVLSCDNLTDNGRKLGAAVRAFAAATDPDTASWIEDQVRFPNAMVDSITPATDDTLRARVAQAIGMEDAWPIQRERFTQWVVEDDFAGERPELERAGVTFTRDVHGFEAAKLRLLNGPHSTLAYVGLGLGHGSVAQAMADTRLAGFVEQLMREDIAPSVAAPDGFDLSGYIGDILKRFANPAIEHKLSQIAWDGSQKLPYRILDTTRDALAAGRPIDRLVVPIAAWLRFIERAAASGSAITDPLAERLLAAGGDWRAILAMGDVFGDLGDDPRFVAAVTRAHGALADPAGYALVTV
ncbi:mannitol dehydrogenase family protein [Sphingomonas turrisvirgatae]|uniref:Mannitol dehydrogenase n=1 Tax=Sphingomonas turrisvirgatae TaxID=1888892 RepID=A0A1E3LTW1_9SPHN|nr:mannitol dehydrogenase family protein [Sphingomonas turrisvirgatae]ODP37211.1 mannitol dehydrogenase [Sphingomonas turrisvirgatae]